MFSSGEVTLLRIKSVQLPSEKCLERWSYAFIRRSATSSDQKCSFTFRETSKMIILCFRPEKWHFYGSKVFNYLQRNAWNDDLMFSSGEVLLPRTKSVPLLSGSRLKWSYYVFVRRSDTSTDQKCSITFREMPVTMILCFHPEKCYFFRPKVFLYFQGSA